jgi:segregation and condensation protein B
VYFFLRQANTGVLLSVAEKARSMDINQLMPHVEALIFASERPLTQIEMTEIIGQALETAIEADRIATCIEAIKEKYEAEYYPFQLKEIGGGYQFLTKKQFHKTVLQLNGDKHIKKLSSAAMETLSIIAYKQPITKSEIEFIRGVSADYSIQKLLEKELIVIAGRNEEMVGKPLVYTTSKGFMDYLGINSPSQLPQLKDITDKQIVMPTSGLEAIPEDAAALIVTDDGELKQAS